MKRSSKHLLAILLTILLLLGMLSGCSAKKEFTEGTAAASASANGYADYADGEMPVEAASEDLLTIGTQVVNDDTKASSFAEKIIYSGYLSIETTEFDRALTAVESLVKEFSGFTESTNINGHTNYRDDGTRTLVNRNAYYVLRIPCDRFDEFLKRSGSIGNVLNSETNAENITSQFSDAEARKTALKTQEDRLLHMMEQTEDMESLIALESRLSDVRYEIEALERQLINWQNQVDYSTVTINLQEVEIFTPVVTPQRSFGQKLADALVDGWQGFVRFIQELLIFLAGALPTLVLLAVLTLGIVLLVRFLKRRRKQKYLPYATPVEEAPDDPKLS